MKLRRCLFAFLISLAAFQFCFSQEKLKAVLFNEDNNLNCEILLASMDVFYSELINEPTAKGFVVIYGKKEAAREKLGYELYINGSIKFRNFDGRRITVIRGAETENLKLQYWKVSVDAEKPAFTEVEWDFVFPLKTKPFIFHNYNENICSSVYFEKAYFEYLNANPDSKGHIAIYAKSLKIYQKEKSEIQNLLSEIPKNRLRFFYIKSDYSNVEFWLVPRKKK